MTDTLPSDILGEAIRVVILLFILYMLLRVFAPIVGYPWPLP